DVLVYTSAPLTEPVEALGRIRAHVWACSSAPATDFTAKLTDVDEQHRSWNVADGFRRVRNLSPTDPVEVEIDLWDTAYVFAAGHRIRLQVASSDFPRYDRAEERAVQRVLHDGAHHSRVVLRVAT